MANCSKKVIIKIKMHSSITKMTSAGWITGESHKFIYWVMHDWCHLWSRYFLHLKCTWTQSLFIMSPLRTKGDILFQSDFFFCFFFCFFSAKLVRTITFLSFQIGQLYLVCGCMTIRQCVAYRNDLYGTLTFDLKVK